MENPGKFHPNFYQRCKEASNYHLKKIFQDSELEENSVIRIFRIADQDGKSYNTNHYNLSAIIAVGYKFNSERAVQFRKWATGIIKEWANAWTPNFNPSTFEKV